MLTSKRILFYLFAQIKHSYHVLAVPFIQKKSICFHVGIKVKLHKKFFLKEFPRDYNISYIRENPKKYCITCEKSYSNGIQLGFYSILMYKILQNFIPNKKSKFNLSSSVYFNLENLINFDIKSKILFNK